VISDDGRYVAFQSRAEDLVALDTNDWSDVFVRDLVLQTTFLVSANALGRGGNQLSSGPILGSDGRTILFQSFASNLADGDRNHDRDIFLVRLGLGDSDFDGMPDAWEVAHFENLSRDGSGDLDGDGMSDRAEFAAGTDPLDADPSHSDSMLRFLAISTVAGDTTTLLWNAVPGKEYRVQFKEDLGGPWIDSPVEVTLNGTQAQAVESTSVPAVQRYYRVLVLP
jgi:hypothetical protein